MTQIEAKGSPQTAFFKQLEHMTDGKGLQVSAVTWDCKKVNPITALWTANTGILPKTFKGN